MVLCEVLKINSKQIDEVADKIGSEVALELLEQDTIYDFDISNKIEDYLGDIIYGATNKAIEVIEENDRDVINTYL